MRVPSGPKERGREGEGVVRNRDENFFFSATLAYSTLCIQLSLERALFLFNKYICICNVYVQYHIYCCVYQVIYELFFHVAGRFMPGRCSCLSL